MKYCKDLIVKELGKFGEIRIEAIYCEREYAKNMEGYNKMIIGDFREQIFNGEREWQLDWRC